MTALDGLKEARRLEELRETLTEARDMLLYLTRGVWSPTSDKFRHNLLPKLQDAIDALAEADAGQEGGA